MATPKHTRIPIDGDDPNSFPVMYEVEIGRVEWRGDGELNPAEAAMLVIARHARDGRYSFPGPHEDTTTTVTIEGIE